MIEVSVQMFAGGMPREMPPAPYAAYSLPSLGDDIVPQSVPFTPELANSAQHNRQSFLGTASFDPARRFLR